ncbi:DUF2783 domain-containing protein [Sphingosinicella sp.]|jgi:hypothetical protein|uniref:DUF2783 domain-containing protein n=1 Tax=Sphingosinicella sp. TaxID=1917971 RepID=UPI002617B4C5|nr:DUF2783 domain-containing protein [Sphingosinicella sp.]MEA3539514.1 DUF2783 domain-containing protein [Pseudomonadota bacterium]
MSLETKPNVARPDDIYEALIAAQAGMSEAESLRFSARLILLLINQIGNDALVKDAIRAARAQAQEAGSDRRA